MNSNIFIEKIKGLSISQKMIPCTKKNIAGISEIPGLYALWWVDDFELLKKLNRKVLYQGKKVSSDLKDISIEKGENFYSKEEQNWDWGLEGLEPTCLYVGKSTNLKKRLNLHFKFGIKAWYKHPSKSLKDFKVGMLLKHTTSCQMRAGVEHLFKDLKNPKRGNEFTLDEKLKNLKISYFTEECFKERFYLEDLAIGYFRPWFNLDSER